MYFMVVILNVMFCDNWIFCIIGRGIRWFIMDMRFVILSIVRISVVDNFVVIIWFSERGFFFVIVIVVIDFMGCIGIGILKSRFVYLYYFMLFLIDCILIF